MQIPPRTATDQYLAQAGKHLDITFDKDLGELVKGHHVIARGIMLGRPVHVPRPDLTQVRDLLSADAGPACVDGFFENGEGPNPAAAGDLLSEAALHYEFAPGLVAGDDFGWYWMLHVTDDAGTDYSDNNTGAFDSRPGQAASHGSRDLGGQIPPQARRLTIGFEPAPGWTPSEPWCRTITIDLRGRRLIG